MKEHRMLSIHIPVSGYSLSVYTGLTLVHSYQCCLQRRHAFGSLLTTQQHCRIVFSFKLFAMKLFRHALQLGTSRLQGLCLMHSCIPNKCTGTQLDNRQSMARLTVLPHTRDGTILHCFWCMTGVVTQAVNGEGHVSSKRPRCTCRSKADKARFPGLLLYPPCIKQLPDAVTPSSIPGGCVLLPSLPSSAGGAPFEPGNMLRIRAQQHVPRHPADMLLCSAAPT